jgi:uncharacterized protein (DUF2141 family)
MRSTLVLLAGGLMVAASHAGEIGAELHPMPTRLPLVFFSPDSLAGTLLKPLAGPEPATIAPDVEEVPVAPVTQQIEPAAGSPSQSAAGTVPEEPAGDATDPAAEAAASAEQPAVPPASEVPSATAATEEGLPADAAGEAEVAAPETAEPSGTIVHIIVENVESSSGRVNVAVCDTSLSEDGCPYHTSVPASAGFVEAELNVPPGRYAVVGYHDVNNNDQFDKFLGVPREPYALSGRAAESLVPDFNDAALKINQGANYVIIRMKRLGNG